MNLFPITATISQGRICLQENELANKPELEGGSHLILQPEQDWRGDIQGGGGLPAKAGQGAAQNTRHPNNALLTAGLSTDGTPPSSLMVEAR